jgi:crotonobetainyl-CoA:carnitine CoA-transferase CaiB-like acyl-CoA transferase
MPLDPARLFLDHKLRELGVMVLERSNDYGAMWEVGHTTRFATRTDIRTNAVPSLGQDTVRVLMELGRSDADVEAMLAKKAAKAAGLAPAGAART